MLKIVDGSTGRFAEAIRLPPEVADATPLTSSTKR
jgi:hypothetical protein